MAIMTKFANHLRAFLVGAAGLVLIPLGGQAADDEPLPAGALSGVEHLLSLVGPGNGEKFEAERVAGLMDFITRPKQGGTRYSAGTGNGLSSSYIEADVAVRLNDLLRYSFNPSIPWFATTPSSLRTSSWKQTDKPWSDLPRLWELLGAGDAPVVIRGLETVENTPDMFSGAYYRYDLYRTLILFTSGGRRTAISISKQKDVSDVGRKGYIIGNDEDWNYFYSGEPGLNVTGLGWVKSYMFDSAGISVYTEPGGGPPLVRSANFKWLRGGWSNINVIQNDHIYQGMQRFTRAFKEVLESPQLPPVKKLEDDCRRIAGLPDDALRDHTRSWRRMLAARVEKIHNGVRKNLPDSFWADSYWDGLNREAMQSALVLETLKTYLGKPTSPQPDSVFMPSLQAPN
jgi:hypothetical protein